MTPTRRTFSERLSRRQVVAVSAGGLAGAGLAVAAVLRPKAKATPGVTDAAFAGPSGDVWLGLPDAKVTLIEYAAVTCSHCAEFHDRTWPHLKARWIDTGQVRFALRGFPLNALDVAGFMIARSDGGRNYYAVTDLLFEKQTSWAFVPKPLDAMRDLLRQAGFTRERLDAVLGDQGLYDEVNSVRARADADLGVHATPTLFVDGRRHEGAPSSEALDGIIQTVLAS